MKPKSSVFLCTDYEPSRLTPYGFSMFSRILDSAKKQDGNGFTMVSNPDDADIIIFAETKDYYQTSLLKSSFYRNYQDRIVVFSQQDHCLPRIPGVYTRIPRSLHGVGIYEYGFYSKVFEFDALDEIPPDAERRFLFSFMGNGRACPEVRRKILVLPKERALLIDTQVAFGDTSGNYAKSLAQSDFVLAPRGLGPTTFRMFEAMRAGRAPVIISDEWKPMAGIKWDDFSVRIPESRIAEIPAILESRVHEAKSMGMEARRIYNACFSKANAFSWLVRTSERLLEQREGNSKYIHRSLWREAIRYGLWKSTGVEIATNLFSRHESLELTRHS